MTLYIFACIKSVQECRCVRVQSSSWNTTNELAIQPTHTKATRTLTYARVKVGLMTITRKAGSHSSLQPAGSLPFVRRTGELRQPTVRSPSASFSILSSPYKRIGLPSVHTCCTRACIYACILLCIERDRLWVDIFFFSLVTNISERHNTLL